MEKSNTTMNERKCPSYVYGKSHTPRKGKKRKERKERRKENIWKHPYIRKEKEKKHQIIHTS